MSDFEHIGTILARLRQIGDTAQAANDPPALLRCVGFEPHPLAIYADEFCVAPVYVGGRPHYCGHPRSEHEQQHRRRAG